VFTDDDFRYRGSGFEAHGVVHDPKPVQLPHPPIWIGGSSRLSRERVVRHGSGWAPLRSTRAFARTVRTAAMAELGDLARAVRDLHRMLDDAGRDRGEVSIHVDLGSMERRPDEILDEVGQLAAIGVTHCLVRPPAGSLAAALEAIERFGSEVVARNPVGR
jgi:alkanesulfonate monooxygenase SsuD/methylene tetrahydromethanopterin reductase-like flavin-dependent oxidoreductase (luciferase family)